MYLSNSLSSSADALIIFEEINQLLVSISCNSSVVTNISFLREKNKLYGKKLDITTKNIITSIGISFFFFAIQKNTPNIILEVFYIIKFKIFVILFGKSWSLFN